MQPLVSYYRCRSPQYLPLQFTGLGPIGLGTALLCKAMGARVLGVEARPERLELARNLGITDVVSPMETHALDLLRERTNDDGVEVAIDCSGNATARHTCLELTHEWGRVVFVGEGSTVSFAPSPLLIHKQLALYGSWVCSLPQMEDLATLLARWKWHPDGLVTHCFPLEQAKEAYELFDSGKTGKIVITWA